MSDFEQLYSQWSGMLLAWLRGRGVPLHDIDDFAQKAWLKAWKHLQMGRTLDQPGAWLKKVAMNEFISGRRGVQVVAVSQVVGDEAEMDPVANLADPRTQHAGLAALERTEAERNRQEAVRGCLEGLPDGDSQIVALVYSGKRPRQIAEELGVDAGVLYTRKSRALTRFKQCLEGQEANA